MSYLRMFSIGSVVAVLLAGCSTVSPRCDVPRASGNEGARIVVFRPSALVGMLYGTPLSIDGCRVQNVGNDSCAFYVLPPGNHKIAVEKRTAELGSGQVVEATFEAGKTYYLHQSVSFVAGLSLVTEEAALKEMPELAKVEQCDAP